MSQNSTIRKFIDRNVERLLVREFLLSKTEKAGFGGLDFQRTPEGPKVTLSAERVGMVIGRGYKGMNGDLIVKWINGNAEIGHPTGSISYLDKYSVEVIAC